MKKFSSLIILLLSIIIASQAEDIDYVNYSVARLSYVMGSSYIQRASDLAYEEGVVNMPIGEGDRIGTTDGRVEIFFGRGNYFRLNNDTKVDFLSLPTKTNDLTQVRIWSGNIYFSIDSLAGEKSIEIHSSDVSVYILDEGLYRIDVRPNQGTEIFVFKGLVEAAGESGSILIKEAQRIEAENGRLIDIPTRFYATAEDSFDRWSESRETQLRERMARTYLPDEMYDFEHELTTYGHWAYISPYGNVWIPGRLDSDWRPYYNGRWVWMRICGWTWLPYEPWGWVTFHFGRWQWSFGTGWYWIPTNIWGPGWVSWYWGHDYCGWTPLSYRGYPGVIINNIYYDRYSGASYPHASRALTVVHKNQLQSRHIAKVALSPDSIKGISKIQLTKAMPALRPENSNLSVEKLSGNKVFLHRSEQESRFEDSSRAMKDALQKRESTYINKTVKGTSFSTPASKRDKRIRKETGYPSSDEISIRKFAGDTRTNSSKSAMSRFYDYFNKESRKSSIDRYSRSSSRDAYSGTVKSGSSTESKSSSIRSSRSSTSKTSSKKSSQAKSSRSKSSTRTKKKKK
ncbi:MAG: hypothetical protein JXB23_13550 [Candidatus Aminicenantes bacterium]|nr:hypothetical protein [Candidatus Aminicenantes bacterium]